MKAPRIILDTPSALVVAADLGAGGSSAEFFATVEREAELLRIDHALFGRAVTKAGRRVPPEEWGRREWPPMRLVWESGTRRRGSAVGSVGVSSWWPDPLSFIGRAANEGT